MPEDERSLIEKIEALAREGSGATDGERAAAVAALRRIRRVAAPRIQTGRVLTRESVMAQNDRDSVRWVKVRYPSGNWYTLDEDMVDWEQVDSMQLTYRVEGDDQVRVGKRRVQRL